ncbi:hypothetical protein LINGRAHAP2_LOCUS4435 [Linum grandiflorum]
MEKENIESTPSNSPKLQQRATILDFHQCCRRRRLKLPNQIIQIFPRRSSFFNSFRSRLPQHLHSPPHLFTFVLHHQTFHRLLNRVTPHDPSINGPLIHPNPNSNLHHIRHHLLVQELLRRHRPSHHRNPGRHSFQRRIPPAVSQKPSNRLVLQDQDLRRPASNYQASPFHPLLESCR